MEIIKSGNSLLLKTTSEILQQMRSHFSVEGNSFGRKPITYDNRKYAITPSGSFFPGMLKEIEKYLILNKIPYEISQEAKDLFSKQIPAIVMEELDGIKYRDYQILTIQNFFAKGRGLAILPTSAGKTAVMGGFCKTYLKYHQGKILIAVPNKILLNQTYKDFISFGINDVTKYSGEDQNDTDWSKSIVIATFAKIVQRKKVKNPDKKGNFKDIKEFIDYDVIIVDEVHQLSKRENNILKFISRCTTNHKFGLTGTLPEDQTSVWNIVGRIGPVLYKEESINLRNAGYISNVQVKILKFIHKDFVSYIPQPDDLPQAAYIYEKEYLMKNKKRNSVLVDLCRKASNNILILVDRIEHGELLKKYLDKNCEGKQIFFVHGETSSEARDEVKQKMEENDNVICVAIVKLFSTGVSINNLPWIVMTGIGKSKIQLFQTIGRSLRLHKNKKIATIFDFSDDTYYSENHLRERIEHYDKERIDYKIKEI